MKSILIRVPFTTIILSIVELVIPDYYDTAHAITDEMFFSKKAIRSAILFSTLSFFLPLILFLFRPFPEKQNIFCNLSSFNLFSSIVFAIFSASSAVFYLIAKESAKGKSKVKQFRDAWGVLTCASFISLILSLYPYCDNPILLGSTISTLFPPVITVLIAIFKSFLKDKVYFKRAG